MQAFVYYFKLREQLFEEKKSSVFLSRVTIWYHWSKLNPEIIPGRSFCGRVFVRVPAGIQKLNDTQTLETQKNARVILFKSAEKILYKFDLWFKIISQDALEFDFKTPAKSFGTFLDVLETP